MVVLLALLSSSGLGWSVSGVESHGRVACGAVLMPVVVVEVAAEEPSLWRSLREAGGVRATSSERVVLPLVREALLSLPPPSFV